MHDDEEVLFALISNVLLQNMPIERNTNPVKKMKIAKVSTKFQNVACQFFTLAHSEHGVERTIEWRFSIENVII